MLLPHFGQLNIELPEIESILLLHETHLFSAIIQLNQAVIYKGYVKRNPEKVKTFSLIA